MKGFSDAAAPCLAFYFFTNDVWAPSPYVRPIGASDGDYRQASSHQQVFGRPLTLIILGKPASSSEPLIPTMGKLCRFLEPLTYTMGKLILKKPRRPKPHHPLALHATFPLPAISVISSPAVIPLSTTSSLAIPATSPCKAPQSSSMGHSTHHHHLPPLQSLSGGDPTITSTLESSLVVAASTIPFSSPANPDSTLPCTSTSISLPSFSMITLHASSPPLSFTKFPGWDDGSPISTSLQWDDGSFSPNAKSSSSASLLPTPGASSRLRAFALPWKPGKTGVPFHTCWRHPHSYYTHASLAFKFPF